MSDRRAALVTGAAGGIGRAVAERLLDDGLDVLSVDLDADGLPGTGCGADLTTREGNRAAVDAALEAFGRLDVVVNNAGFVRDRMFANAGEDEWDAVVRVHLKGHFCVARWAASYWRDEAKAGRRPDARIVNTTSGAGLQGSVGQAAYSAAKGGIATLTLVQAAELGRYGVTANAIAPAARTRMTESTPGLSDVVKAPSEAGAFDVWDPANISPLVAYLSTESCPANGKVFFVQGGTVKLFQGWTMTDGIEKNDRWSVSELEVEMKKLVV